MVLPPHFSKSTTRSLLTAIKHARVQNDALLVLTKLQNTEFEIMQHISLMTLLRVCENARPPKSSWAKELAQASYDNYTEKCDIVHDRIIQKFSFTAKLLEESLDSLKHFQSMVSDGIRTGEFRADYYKDEPFGMKHINLKNFVEFYKCECAYGVAV